MDLNSENFTNDYVEVQTIYEPAHYEYSITASSFDSHQELFWTGNVEGRVSSYYSLTMSKYTSFRINTDTNFEIKMLYPHVNNDLFILTSDALASYSSFGIKNFVHKEVSFQNLQIMDMNCHDRFFLGGFSNFIYDFDIERLRILRQLSIGDEQSDCILIKSSSASKNGPNNNSMRNGILCTGSSNGQIILRDPFTLKYLHKFHPHNGSLSDFDVHGNNLITCGFSLTRNGNLCVDRFLMVYDLRMMRSLSPVQLIIEPCFLYYLPMCSSMVAVGSQAGCFQLTDTNLITQSTFYQAQVPVAGLATTFSMSSNAMAFAFGHSTGSIHLFSKGENGLFNDFSEQTLLIEPPQYNSNYIDINQELAPLSSVPIPIVNDNEPLLSDWPTNETSLKYQPTPAINQELLENARVIHGIISVPNKIDLKRNQIFNDKLESFLMELKKNSKKTAIELINLVETKSSENKNSDNVNEQSDQERLFQNNQNFENNSIKKNNDFSNNE